MARADDDKEDLARWLEYAETRMTQVKPSGRAAGGLYMALSIARGALDSGKPRNIANALRNISPLIAHANQIAHFDKETSIRHIGGLKASEARAEKRSEGWAPYEQIYYALAAGRDRAGRLKARAHVVRKM